MSMDRGLRLDPCYLESESITALDLSGCQNSMSLWQRIVGMTFLAGLKVILDLAPCDFERVSWFLPASLLFVASIFKSYCTLPTHALLSANL
jgi:hypothetical protein